MSLLSSSVSGKLKLDITILSAGFEFALKLSDVKLGKEDKIEGVALYNFTAHLNSNIGQWLDLELWWYCIDIRVAAMVNGKMKFGLKGTMKLKIKDQVGILFYFNEKRKKQRNR